MSLLDEAKRQSGKSRSCAKCKLGGLCPPDILDICHKAFVEGFIKGHKFKRHDKD